MRVLCPGPGREGKDRTGCNEEGKSGSASPDHLRGKVRWAADPRAADFEGVGCQAFFTGQLSLCWRKNPWIGSLGLDNFTCSVTMMVVEKKQPLEKNRNLLGQKQRKVSKSSKQICSPAYGNGPPLFPTGLNKVFLLNIMPSSSSSSSINF